MKKLAALLLVCACFNPLPAPATVSNQPQGGPCLTTASCAAGLACEQFTAGSSFAPGDEVSSLCTTSCGTCASGTTCLTSGGATPDGGITGVCIPTCTSNDDCRYGGRAQVCAATINGSMVCQFLECGGGGDSACHDPNVPCKSPQCPTGYRCVAQPSQFGFCEKSP